MILNAPMLPIRRQLQARAENLSTVRQWIGDVCRWLRMSEDEAADVKLAVSEACTNVVVHAYADQAPGLLEIEADRCDDRLCVVVRDRGRGFTPRSDSPGAGLGLPLMAALSQRIELRRPDPPAATEMALTFELPRRDDP